MHDLRFLAWLTGGGGVPVTGRLAGRPTVVTMERQRPSGCRRHA